MLDKMRLHIGQAAARLELHHVDLAVKPLRHRDELAHRKQSVIRHRPRWLRVHRADDGFGMRRTIERHEHLFEHHQPRSTRGFDLVIHSGGNKRVVLRFEPVRLITENERNRALENEHEPLGAFRRRLRHGTLRHACEELHEPRTHMRRDHRHDPRARPARHRCDFVAVSRDQRVPPRDHRARFTKLSSHGTSF